jgi:signal peptidase I
MSARRRPVVAALLSLLIVGLGDAYNGFTRRGARLLAAMLGSMVVVALAWSVVTALSIAPWAALLFLLYAAVTYGFHLYAAVRAWRDARRLRETPPHRLRASVLFALAAIPVMLVVTGAIRAFLMQAFKNPSGAMTPTLLIGDHVLVNKLEYGPRFAARRLFDLRAPRRGDIVVFIWPKDRSKDFVKRVVAMGGETIEIRERRVIVDGTVRDDPYARWTDARSETEHWGPVTVPPGHVFVMGDNRDSSYDSRFWGSVPVADLYGKVTVVYWSWDVANAGVRWDRVGLGLD